MPIFKSKHPDIVGKLRHDEIRRSQRPETNELLVPDNVTIWEWLFEESSKYCPLAKYPEEQLAGFVDAATKERVSWKDVKSAAIFISTALTRTTS